METTLPHDGKESVLLNIVYRHITKRVHIHYHYGIRPQKTILIMVLGT